MFLAAVRRWVRVLWVCRVSFASWLAGTILLVFVAQGRDLFLEFPNFDNDTGMAYAAAVMVWYAVRFGFLVLLFWALPVHASARLGLNRPEWLTSPYGPTDDPCDLDVARAAFLTPVIWIPRILAILCFVAAMAGITWTSIDLLTGPKRDTSSSANFALLAYFVALAAFGTVFLFYVIRRRRWFERVVDPHRRAGRALRVPPAPPAARGSHEAGILGDIDRAIIWFLLVVLIAVLAIPSLLDSFPRLLLVPVLLGAWVPALGWLGRLSHATKVPLIALTILGLAIVSYKLGDNHDVVASAAQKRDKPQIQLADAVGAWKKANQCDAKGASCPSPVIVATTGGASRSAFMTASVLGLLLDASCVDPAHRAAAAAKGDPPIDCAEAPAFGRRLFAISSVSGGSLGAAVYARGYADGQPSGPAHPQYAPPCRSEPPSTLWFKGTRPRGWRDCLQVVLAEDFLSPVFAGLGFRDVFSFIGSLAAKVHLNNLWPDRGRRIEQAWIGAYDKFTAEPAKDPGENKSAGLGLSFTSLTPSSPNEAVQTPWRPLLLLNGTSVETGRRIVASHLVPGYRTRLDDTGSSGTPSKELCVRLFTDTYDLHEILNGASRDKSACTARPADEGFLDLTIAGAAHNSARFPVVSPAGNLMRADESAGRVVDGGYFDNYGALTAFDLADTLRWEYGLYPFVLLITNDPKDNGDTEGSTLPWFSAQPDKFAAPRQVFASVAVAPVDTILAVRSGHGSTALKLLRGIVDPEVYQRRVSPDERKAEREKTTVRSDPTCFGISAQTETPDQTTRHREPCFARVGIFPQLTEAGTIKDVSMSWWLSKPVQNYIDDQLVDERNLREFDLVCAAITRGWSEGQGVDLDRERICRDQVRRLVGAPPLAQ